MYNIFKRPSPGDQALFLEEAHHLNAHFFLNLMRSYDAKNKYFFRLVEA